MQTATYAMSLAGLDPSGGAGLLADIKTFEAHGVTGFGVCTALTMQTDDAFLGVDWIPAEKIIVQAAPLLEKFPVQYCKVGLMEHPLVLLEVLTALKRIRPNMRFILDPVLKASAGYVFHAGNTSAWMQVLPELYLLTPNYEEAMALTGAATGEEGAEQLADHCAVLLKGGHRAGRPGVDTLYNGTGYTDFAPWEENAHPKHGSGCVLSAAITALLANNYSQEEACQFAKRYTYLFLKSDTGLLGRHQPVLSTRGK